MKLWEAFLLSENIEFTKRKFGTGERDHDYSHKSHVDGHHVEVTFDKHDVSSSHDHYRTHFHINHSSRHSDGTGDVHKNKKILMHVHHVVKNFIKKHKPASLTFIPHDDDEHHHDRKKKAYAKFADHLAKKHGGEAEHDEDHSRVYF